MVDTRSLVDPNLNMINGQKEEKRARVDEVAPPGRSASRTGASPRSERSLRLSASFLHIARGLMTSLRLGRSGSRKSSTRGWAQSGYATSLREVALVQSGCHTSFHWVALHSNRLERVHQVASEPHSNSHFAKMIIFYSLKAQMSPNTSQNSKGCSNT
ncbi:hypothetical protein F2Q70_00018285 [Brassica cretica]|uniref:Uncharacterized protein n=1 Tax=Brassica cretica TaxID=69181 RepID=A0A8S9HZ03_BRACR|nr:hypothetical protein F2Q70_00018285 [Brassica cretica]